MIHFNKADILCLIITPFIACFDLNSYTTEGPLLSHFYWNEIKVFVLLTTSGLGPGNLYRTMSDLFPPWRSNRHQILLFPYGILSEYTL